MITKLYIGLNDKDTNLQAHSTELLKSVIMDTLFKHGFNGFTMQEACGVYKYENGAIARENTIIIEIANNHKDTIPLIDELKQLLNQECIMISQYESITKFI